MHEAKEVFPSSVQGDVQAGPADDRCYRQLTQRLKAWARRCAMPAAGLMGLGMAWAFLEYRQRRGQRKRNLPQGGAKGRQVFDRGGDDCDDDRVRIPLRDVIRFKERQWFIEEVENARQGDANAMLRLAKMHLHGQGCDQNLPMAQEWLRKARHMGIFSTLEEIWAGELEELDQLRAAALARAAKRRSLASQGTAAGASVGMGAMRASH